MKGRAPTSCANPTCIEVALPGSRYCAADQHLAPTHGWHTSTRKARLPKGWATIRARVLKRDKRTCYLCGAHATEVDHVVRGDDHDMSNLKAICHTCHKEKTLKERRRSR